MSAPTMQTGAAGDNAECPAADHASPFWSRDEAASDIGEGDGEGAGDSAHDDSAPVELKTPGARQGAGFTEQQLVDWLDAIVDQDERALAALYDATFSRVYGLVHRILRRTALTEEVVEDAYFQVWRQAVRFDPARGQALTWLLSIARSRAIDALRHEARFEHDSIDDDAAESADETRPCDELLDLARHRAALHTALMQLGAQPRQLVALAFFRGLTHEEIAQQTSLPLGTVKSQIRRALLALHQILGQGGLDQGGSAALAS